MNQLTQSYQPEHTSTRDELNGETLVVSSPTSTVPLMNPQCFDQMQRVALIMAQGIGLPQHFLGRKDGNRFVPYEQKQVIASCVRIVNQAFRWDMDPFAVADESYEVHGKLSYQGKLVAALVNSRGGLRYPLSQRFEGTGDDLRCFVIGHFKSESEPRPDPDGWSVKQARPKLKPNEMWKTDPVQKLWYSAVVRWARRHCPELVLGVQTTEDSDVRQAMQQAEPTGIEYAQRQDRTTMTAERELPPEPEPEAVDKNVAEPTTFDTIEKWCLALQPGDSEEAEKIITEIGMARDELTKPQAKTLTGLVEAAMAEVTP